MKLAYILIKEKNNNICITIEQFKRLFSANECINFVNETTLEFKGKKYSYALSAYEVGNDSAETKNEVVFNFTINTCNKKWTEGECADNLVNLDTYLKYINSSLGGLFIINTVWDDASMHYTTILYPKFITVENQLRNIIYRFMIKACGNAWFEQSIPENVKSSIEKTLKKNNKDFNSISEDYLYYADFIQLSSFLFTEYPLKKIDHNAIELIKNKLSENKMKIDEILSDYEPKSNWDRYFVGRIQISELPQKWKKLYKYRNIVAHSKRMNKNEFQEAQKLLDELCSSFKKYLESSDDIKMNDEETEAVREVANATIIQDNITINPALANALTMIGSDYNSLLPSHDVACSTLTNFALGVGSLLDRYNRTPWNSDESDIDKLFGGKLVSSVNSMNENDIIARLEREASLINKEN